MIGNIALQRTLKDNPNKLCSCRNLSITCMYYNRCNYMNTTDATSGAGTAYPSGAPEFTPGFQQGSRYSICSFMCMFCRSLFVLLSFFFQPLCCLFFELRILITPLVCCFVFSTHQALCQYSPLSFGCAIACIFPGSGDTMFLLINHN